MFQLAIRGGRIRPTPLYGVNSALVEPCRKKLTYFIGPIADAVVKEALSQSAPASPKHLVEILTEQIPNLADADKFREQLLLRGSYTRSNSDCSTPYQENWLPWEFGDKRRLSPKQSQYFRDSVLDERVA
jgi:hypothetical protein